MDKQKTFRFFVQSDMDGEKTWTVVQFLDDSTVEAVPSPWIQGELCHWPSFSLEKVAIAIKKWEPLNTCWPLHKVKVFRNATFGMFTKQYVHMY